MKLFFILFTTFFCFHEGFSQEFSAKMYSDSLDEYGENIAVDTEGNSYLFSYFYEDRNQNSAQGVLLRKVDRNGNILKSLQFERDAGFDLFPKDIIINDEGNVVCLYMRDKSGSPVFNQTTFLQIKELDADLNETQDEVIRLDNRAFSSSEAHITQLTNGDYAIMSPRITPPNPEFSANNAIVSRFDENFSFMYSLDLKNISRRARCFAQVENDNIIVGGPGETGALVEKVDILDSIVVWEAILPFEGVGFNRIYSVVSLDDLSGYGFITNYANVIDSLSGIVYFETDIEGSVTSSTLFNEYNWSPGHFPSMNQGECEGVIITYLITDETNNTKTRYLQVEPGGNIVNDVVMDFVVEDDSKEYIREFIPFIGDTLVGIGGGMSSTFSASTLFVKLSICDRILSLRRSVDVQAVEKIVSYPNPNSGNELFLSNLDVSVGDEMLYQIVDQAGRVVYTGRIQNSDPINIAGLKAGFYFLSITSNSRRMVSKFVVE